MLHSGRFWPVSGRPRFRLFFALAILSLPSSCCRFSARASGNFPLVTAELFCAVYPLSLVPFFLRSGCFFLLWKLGAPRPWCWGRGNRAKRDLSILYPPLPLQPRIERPRKHLRNPEPPRIPMPWIEQQILRSRNQRARHPQQHRRALFEPRRPQRPRHFLPLPPPLRQILRPNPPNPHRRPLHAQ
jgi:hypothetical protein